MPLVVYESDAGEQTSPIIVQGIVKQLITRKEGSKNMAALHLRLSQGGFVKEHYHEQEEIYYIQSGEAKVTVDGSVSQVRKGGVVFIPSNAKHQLANAGNDPLMIFAITSPPREPPK